MAVDLGFVAAHNVLVRQAPCAQIPAATVTVHSGAKPSIGNSFSSSTVGICAAALGVRSLTRAQRPARRRKTARAVQRNNQAAESSIELTEEELHRLHQGLPVQRQQVFGREGSGTVVLDVDAPSSVVLDQLRSFQDYPQMIPVIRHAEIHSRGRDAEGRHQVHARYRVSKFWLNISVVHSVDVAAKQVSFKLHPDCGKMVLKEAIGCWTVTQAQDPAKSRVTLDVQLKASSLLPSWLVDYAANRALRRATCWLKPHVEHVWQEQMKSSTVHNLAEVDRPLPYLLA